MSKYTECKFKKDRIALLREKLGTNEAWAIKGLTVIFDYQTADEQNAERTMDHNGVGFTGVDGEILSSFAKQIRDGKTMSEKQMNIIDVGIFNNITSANFIEFISFHIIIIRY